MGPLRTKDYQSQHSQSPRKLPENFPGKESSRESAGVPWSWWNSPTLRDGSTHSVREVSSIGGGGRQGKGNGNRQDLKDSIPGGCTEAPR